MSTQELLIAFFKGAKEEIKIDPSLIGDITVGGFYFTLLCSTRRSSSSPRTDRHGPPSQGSLRRSRFGHCCWIPRFCSRAGHQPVSPSPRLVSSPNRR